MYEEDYEHIIKEYREVISGLFRIVLNHLKQSEYEKFNLNIKMESMARQKDMEDMIRLKEGGDKV